MPIGTCDQCAKKYYHNDKQAAISGRIQSHTRCTDCELRGWPRVYPVANVTPDRFQAGERAAIQKDNPLHYTIVVVEEVTPAGRVIAGGRCFSDGHRAYDSLGGQLVSLTPEIEDWCLHANLFERLRSMVNSPYIYKRISSNQISTILDLLYEVVPNE